MYKSALDVAVWFEQAVAGSSRYHKYTLGSELRQQSREIVSLIAQANNEQDKAPHLKQLRIKLDELLILMRIAKEARVLVAIYNPFLQRDRFEVRSALVLLCRLLITYSRQ